MTLDDRSEPVTLGTGQARSRAAIEATMMGLQAALVALSTKNRVLEQERDRLTREVAALARVLADSGLLQGIDPKRIMALASRQDEVELRMKASDIRLKEAEARVTQARQAQSQAELRYRVITKSTSWRITGPLRRVIRLVRGR